MNTRLSITLDRRNRDRLERLALGYGLGLPQFARRVLEALESEFSVESLAEYERPHALRASLARAMRDLSAGRVSTSL